MKPLALLIFDTETTGLTLHPDAPLVLQPKMIEFGAVWLDAKTGNVTREFSHLINPREPITAEITKITGITDEAVAGAPTFDDLLPVLREAFGGSLSMCAHNLPFDRAVVRGELTRRGIEDFPWPARELCTVGLYREQWGFMPKLTKLYELVMGRPLVQKHRALDDVLAMVEIIQREKLWELML